MGTVITGRLTSTPDTAFTVEFFANDSLDGSGNGEGDAGQASFTVTVAAALPDQIITATARTRWAISAWPS